MKCKACGAYMKYGDSCPDCGKPSSVNFDHVGSLFGSCQQCGKEGRKVKDDGCFCYYCWHKKSYNNFIHCDPKSVSEYEKRRCRAYDQYIGIPAFYDKYQDYSKYSEVAHQCALREYGKEYA